MKESDRKRQLERAITWFQQAPHIHRASSSAGYGALVTAIESLLETSRPPKCSKCNQPKYATTKRFKDFLEKHIPCVGKHPEVRDRLYRVRSKITHGGDMFEEDIEPWRSLSTAKGDEEMSLYWNAHQLVSIAIYNWLWSK
jgi:hypothetical protein